MQTLPCFSSLEGLHRKCALPMSALQQIRAKTGSSSQLEKPQKESLPHQGPSQTPKQDQDLAAAKFLNPPSLTIRPLCQTCEPLGKTSSFLNQPNQFPLSVTNVINSTCGEESTCLPWVPPGSLALWCVQNVSCRLLCWETWTSDSDINMGGWEAS